MSILAKIELLRAYALTAKTSIYNEDAMTAIELAGQTACKVNECVEALNNMLDVVEELRLAVGLQYDPDSENLTI